MSKNIVWIGGSTDIGLKLAGLLKDNHFITIISRSNPELIGVTHHKTEIREDERPNLDGPIDGFMNLPGSINLKPFKMLREENFKGILKSSFLARCDLSQV